MVCWPAIALLGAFAVLIFSLRQGAASGAQAREGAVRARPRDLVGAAKLLLLGVILLGVVLLIPDAGQVEHRSFFSVARDSMWGHLFEWAAAWCSVKIIVLSLSALLILDAMLSLAMDARHQIACVTLLILSVFPLVLGCFGFYQFIKAVF
ncbi:MAG TPA: hypothetical protein VKV04_03200 [Verrucomicrobiae bacterium]|nr:hypothetical protein [Verrucomicrobiae bacterium]